MIPADFDYSKLSPADARSLLLSETTLIERGEGLGYSDALSQARLRNPKLVAALGSDVVVTNNNNIQVSNPLALSNASFPLSPNTFTSAQNTQLGLSEDADTDESKAAYDANKGFTSPRDSKAIWRALTALWSGRQASVLRTHRMDSRFSSGMAVAKRHPALARESGNEDVLKLLPPS